MVCLLCAFLSIKLGTGQKALLSHKSLCIPNQLSETTEFSHTSYKIN